MNKQINIFKPEFDSFISESNRIHPFIKWIIFFQTQTHLSCIKSNRINKSWPILPPLELNMMLIGRMAAKSCLSKICHQERRGKDSMITMNSVKVCLFMMWLIILVEALKKIEHGYG